MNVEGKVNIYPHIDSKLCVRHTNAMVLNDKVTICTMVPNAKVSRQLQSVARKA